MTKTEIELGEDWEGEDTINIDTIKIFSDKATGEHRVVAPQQQLEEVVKIEAAKEAPVKRKARGTRIEIVKNNKLVNRKLYICGYNLAVAVNGVWHRVETNSNGKLIEGRPLHPYESRPAVVPEN